MEDNQLSAALMALTNSLLRLQAKTDLLDQAVYLLMQTAPNKPAIAKLLRRSANELSEQNAAHPLSGDYDEALTLSLAAMLEALGEPPTRS